MKKINLKNIFWSVFLSLIAFSFSLHANTQDVEIGQAAPEITLPNPYGINNNLSALRGKMVLLYFWVSWDPNSRTANKELQSIHNKYSQSKFSNASGFDIFTVSLDYESKEWTDVLRSDRLPGGYHTNDFYSKYAGVYGINKLPAIYIIDGAGIVQLKDASLQQAADWLAGQAIAPDPQTTIQSDPIEALQPVYQPIKTTSSTDSENSEFAPVVEEKNVAVATEKPSKTTTATSASTGKSYRIQVGAYKVVPANKSKELAEFGQVSTEQVGTLQRLLVGNFTQLSEAITVLSDLQAKTAYKDAIIVEYINNKRSKNLTKADFDKTSVIEEPTYKNAPQKTNTSKGSATTTERKALNNNAASVQWKTEFDPTAKAKSTTATTKIPAKTTIKSATTTPKASETAKKTTTTAATENIVVDANQIGVFKRMETDGFVENMSNRSYSTAKNGTPTNSSAPKLKLPTNNKSFVPPSNLPQEAVEEKMSNTSTNGSTYYDESGLFDWYDQPNVTTQKMTTSSTFVSPTNATTGTTIRTTTTSASNNFDNQPTFYDYNDQYISKSYTKANETTTTSSSTVAAPSFSSVKIHTATPPTPTVKATTTTTTTPSPAVTSTTTTTTRILANTSVKTPETPTPAVAAPVAVPTAPTAVTPPTTTPTAKATAHDLDNYLDNYDFSNVDPKKKKPKKSKNR